MMAIKITLAAAEGGEVKRRVVVVKRRVVKQVMLHSVIVPLPP